MAHLQRARVRGGSISGGVAPLNPRLLAVIPPASREAEQTEEYPHLLGQSSEFGGQRAEDSGQRAEDSGQRSEVSGQRSVVGGRRAEVGGRRSEVGNLAIRIQR